MAFNNSPGRAEYTATAGQTVFTYVFKAYNDTDIKVYLTPAGQVADDVADLLTLTTDYTVVISGDVGGTITLVVPASNGDSITLVRTLEIDRQIEYQTSGDLLADTLNQDQNYQTYLIADKESDNTRFLKLQESAQGVSTEIPSPVPLNFFQWNAAGDAIVNVSSLQADGFLWTAADVYTKTETNALLDAKVDTTTLDENAKLWDAQTTTHNFTADADYTLTTAQNAYGRIVLTDTGVVLTTARNVITDNIEKSFIVQNDTLQTITVKTLAGTGISILSGDFAELYNDGTNITSIENDILLAEFEVSGAPVTSIDFTGLDINSHKSYRIEIDLINATASNTNIQMYINGDTTATNYYNQVTTASSTTTASSRNNDAYITTLIASVSAIVRGGLNISNGYPIGIFNGTYALSANLRNSLYSWNKTATVTNITQITFVSTVALAIGIGSKIRIYRGDK